MIVFITTMKRILKQPVNWVFIFLFPIIFSTLISVNLQNSSVDDPTTMNMYFGVVDLDNTILSRTLVKQLKTRYNIKEMKEADITAALTDSEVPWVLLIRKGYSGDVLSGNVPELEGYSLTISDTSGLGNVTAQNITRALMLLGTDDIAVLTAWEDASRVEVTTLDIKDNWGIIAFWFGFFGFVAMFTAYFVIKTLLDEKRGGMPDRLGVLPVTPRRYLTMGTLAAFTATEITAVLLLFIVQVLAGPITNLIFLFIILSLYNLFSVAMVFAIISFVKGLGTAPVVVMMFATIFSMLGGLFWPLDFVPDFMRKLAWFSPGYWLGRGLNSVTEITFEGYAVPVLFLIGFTIVALLLGGWKKIQPMED